MAFIKTEDEKGRIVHVPVFNESEDGSGTWHVPVCDSSGYLKVAMQSVLDDVLWKLGTDSDIVLLNRSTILIADAELTDVIVGTSDHPGVAANSLILSNITASGDLLFLVNKGGNSLAAFWADGSTGDTAILAASGQSIDMYIGGSKIFDISNDGTKTTIMGLAGDYWRIGDAGTTAHSLDSANDQMITGESEVKGASFLDGVTTMGANLVVGTIAVDEDSGAVTLVDMSVSATPADGTEESIAFAIDGNIMLKLYSEADSAGGVDTMSIQILRDIIMADTLSISTPDVIGDYFTLNARNTGVGLVEVARIASGNDPEFKMGNNGNAIRTSYIGKVGFFTTVPQAKPTGVAITAGGIHAALVTLGLIAGP